MFRRKCPSSSPPASSVQSLYSILLVSAAVIATAAAAPTTHEDAVRPSSLGQAEEALGEEQSSAVLHDFEEQLAAAARPRTKRSPPAESRGFSLPDLGSISPEEFLDFVRRHYVLIKTKDGYILGRNMNRGTRSGPVQFRERRYPSSDSNFQLRVRKRGGGMRRSSAADSNFQLRVRKAYPSSTSNFQLRVRKKQPFADRNFQLRVRRPFMSENDAGSNFQLRVRKAFPTNNFQLRVRKAGRASRRSSDRNFQLRVRKSDPDFPEMPENDDDDERLRWIAERMAEEEEEAEQEAAADNSSSSEEE